MDVIATKEKLQAHGGFSLDVIGKCNLHVSCDKKKCDSSFFVVRTYDIFPLLSHVTCFSLDILSKQTVVNALSSERHIENDFDDLFEVVGNVKGVNYETLVQPNAVPKCIPSRKVPPAMVEKISVELERMLNDSVIIPSEFTE